LANNGKIVSFKSTVINYSGSSSGGQNPSNGQNSQNMNLGEMLLEQARVSPLKNVNFENDKYD